jgi:hypothetical protein
MKAGLRIITVVSLFLGVAVAPSAAQETSTQDPSETARFHWGPLRFTPGIAISSVGVDTNVFNTPEDERQDTTAAIGPAANFWVHLKRARLSGKTAGQYLYFKTYGNQRGWDTSNELRLDLPMTRLKPFIAGSYMNTHDRPGFEIDSRSRAATNGVLLGTDWHLSGKTNFVFSGSRTITAFDKRETFLGAELANSLNRREDTESLEFQYALTPLTTFVVRNDAIQDRFASEKTRNADSIRVMPGFLFKPFALISGSAFVGFRHFNALNDALPDFNGVVASVDAQYVVSATRVHTHVQRDLQFSYEDVNPYYTLTDIDLVVTQRITRSWDVVARTGRQTLDYRSLQSAISEGRIDKGHLYGGGFGYRLGDALRLGLDVNYAVRRSRESARDYQGFRAGASVSYGIAP